jgi:magnesium-protoporphyrin O-methyltransferase
MFTAKAARKTLRRYRKKGLTKLERQMVAGVPTQALHGARVLEIGGGIGTIQAELLVGGAGSGEIVELVSAYEPYARELAQDKGIEDRSTFRVADVLEGPETVPPADVVILNRVVCCSPDGVRLTGAAARLAGRMLLLSYPRDRFFVRIGARVMNVVFWIMKRSFRIFLHERSSLYAAAQAEGFVITETGQAFAWEFAALRRTV